MSDIADLADPIEVWEMALGRPAALVELLEGGGPISARTRAALALYFRGELKMKRGRPGGQAIASVWAREMAEFEYWRIAQRLRQRRRFKGKRDWLIEKVALRHGLTFEQLRDFINRKDKPKSGPTFGEGERYALWAARNGRDFSLKKDSGG
ncbi:hypothetical protein [Roseicyclus persicicus]|uniref:Uncharacterized protein n=1 Tax=Roseicyclus persicicus TaxID=2650661 RepID=A0A7X6GWD6_9RHOB|nr:hypothetical protein [Roseibacterium persicicum]NKX43591.1 hypothetical protein [Roseibacterium persicicum]